MFLQYGRRACVTNGLPMVPGKVNPCKSSEEVADNTAPAPNPTVGASSNLYEALLAGSA